MRVRVRNTLEVVMRSINKNGPFPEDHPELGRCWIWLGYYQKYGYVTVDGKTMLIHRYIYEQLRKKIDDKKDLHHICEQTLCCNPDHVIESDYKHRGYSRITKYVFKSK